MQQQLQDSDIIQQVLQGNKAAYAMLVERYQSFVFTIAGRYIAKREEAEEVTQDIFVKAYMSLAGFKGTSKFSTWLYSITHTTCISHLRKNNLQTVYADDEKMAAHADSKGYESAEQYTNTQTLKQAINTAIKQLPPEDAEIITLFYLSEQSLEEIAIITGMQANTVKTKLYRARLKLRDIVERTYNDETKLLYRN